MIEKVRVGKGPEALELANKSEFFMSLFRAADGFLAAETTTIEDGRQSNKILYGREAIEVLFEEAHEAF